MEASLAKIRIHKSSNLPHQKAPATLLLAIESTIESQTPTAYFAVLVTVLEGTIQREDLGLGDGDILPAQLYLLGLVAPFVPPEVIRTHLVTILALTTPLFPLVQVHAPPLKSMLSLYNVVFKSLDKSLMESTRPVFASVLQLSIDQRPKVRRKAAEVIQEVLSNPPSPMIRHPYAERVAQFVEARLAEVISGDSTDAALHTLALLKLIVQSLSPSTFQSLTAQLLQLPRLSNPFLTQSSYTLLNEILSSASEESSTSLPDVLSVILSNPPPSIAIDAWLTVLSSATLALHQSATQTTPSGSSNKSWSAAWTILASPHSNASTRRAAARALSTLAPYSPPSARLEAREALDKIEFLPAMPDLLAVISALIATTTTANDDATIGTIVKVAELRTSKAFEYKDSADAVLSTSMRNFGPHIILTILPLNLEPSDVKEGLTPRAFLLPLLVNAHPSPLSHFISYFVPLSERMFSYAQSAPSPAQEKLWTVLIGQVWNGLVGYCHHPQPADLEDALGGGSRFAVLLTQLLYTQPDLRTSILRALKVLVESNLEDGADDVPTKQKENIRFLSSQSESWLAVLFNVFGNPTTNRDQRAMVGDVIQSWARIAPAGQISKIYTNVAALFQSAKEEKDMMTTQDLLILLIPNLDPTGKNENDSQGLFEIMLTKEVLACKEGGVQKRAYKILAKLMAAGKVVPGGGMTTIETILKKLDESADGLAAAAKKDRFSFISLLLPFIPSTSLHIIPSLIPEAVLGTKEPSEKARSAAFDLIVAMGKRMKEGGVVMRGMLDGMHAEKQDRDDDDVPMEAVANIEEFMTMIAGGLAGASPHMISATITAISRLIFEFKDELSSSMHSEVFSTILVFVSSNNREIVKSTLGYVKLCIHTLDPDLLRPHLPQIVPALLGWAHDHKNHFKVKVRHIFERMLRRFTWEEVYECAGEEGDAAKMLVNIRKRKERAKRKKAQHVNEDQEEEAHDPNSGRKGLKENAFEDVLYGSESELDDSDEEEPAPTTTGSFKRGKGPAIANAQIRLNGDEPTDLLQGSATLVTRYPQTDKRRKPGQEASRFKVDEDTGKMIINEEVDESDNDRTAADVAGTAYRESITSSDGFKRLPNGQVKFNKDNKKRRRENAQLDGDIEMADGESPPKARKILAKSKAEPKFGHEFKAKKAGGDFKKSGVDPYAYMTLSQAAKKTGRGGHGKIGIAKH